MVSHGSSHGGIISSGISSHGGSAYSAPVVTHSVPVTTHVSSGYESGHDHYEQPDPFTFEYGVQDDHYHTDFSEHRSGDAEGNIVGDYKVSDHHDLTHDNDVMSPRLPSLMVVSSM